MEEEINSSLEYTPTWIVASVCFVIVLISLFAARGIHHLGKLLEYKGQDELNEALEKLKEELMLLGFISLLLTAFQGFISRMCIPAHLSYTMLPCKRGTVSSNGSEHYYNLATNNRRRLLSEETNSRHCLHQGKVPLISLEALHQLHIFIFVLAIFHVIFCVSTMVLGGIRIRQWKVWEDSIKEEISRGDPTKNAPAKNAPAYANNKFLKQRTHGFWRKAEAASWLISFFKQFYGSVNRHDYTELRKGFIKEHCPHIPKFDFHKYIVRTLENDFKKIVSISWYLWVFVVVFLLLNVAGWHSYFWLSFLPVILLLFVGAKLEHIITMLAQDAVESKINKHEAQQVTEMTRDNSVVHNVVENVEEHEVPRVKPSDKHFWFSSPDIVLDLLQFILFQNSFEIAFFVWILCIYGFNSCIMEKPGFIITRLVMGVIVQVLCSYCTIPLYALVTQMGSSYKGAMFEEFVHSAFKSWATPGRRRRKFRRGQTEESQIQMQKMAKELPQNDPISEQAIVVIEDTSTSITELTSVAQLPSTSS
ncbi:hypothetical protein ACB098_10G034300 [Castanea mollissima]|uniref:MLO-like protein n=1 Tax=Castanea mollissima TaxID=60419 RepID=A0A8J4S125_9ROSI|nr:hypothetical protein CMV_002750 [Castanea mollissima]